MLLEQTERNGNFLSVKHGAICLESKDPKEGYELIEGEVNGVPYSKYVKKFQGVQGIITKIEWYDREHNGSHYRGLHIKMKDGGEHYIIDLPFEKRQYDYFTKIAENIDYSKPVTFEAWLDVKNAKPGQQTPTAFIAKQDGQIVQWKYTRENPGDCPQPKQTRTGKWNFDDQRDWLLERILTVVAPHVEATNGFNEPEPEYTDSEPVKAKAANEPPYMPPYTGEIPEDIKAKDDLSIPF